ncbi:hypothetical protein SBV1_2270011 [Verrucomicrobia bacterium]|nr:hypothetical protein SBV1_2270011 [Verrucomicrobiota bacterium]
MSHSTQPGWKKPRGSSPRCLPLDRYRLSPEQRTIFGLGFGLRDYCLGLACPGHSRLPDGPLIWP